MIIHYLRDRANYRVWTDELSQHGMFEVWSQAEFQTFKGLAIRLGIKMEEHLDLDN